MGRPASFRFGGVGLSLLAVTSAWGAPPRGKVSPPSPKPVPAVRAPANAVPEGVPTLAVASTAQNSGTSDRRPYSTPVSPPYSPPHAGSEGTSWWSPERQLYYLGFEGTAGASILPKAAVVFGYWATPNVSIEGYLGYTKTTETYNESVATTEDSVSNTRSTVTSYTGSMTPHTFLIGGGARYKVVQTSWFQFTIGGVVAVVPGNNASNRTGTSTQTIQSLSVPTSFTTVETALGTVTSDTNWQLSVGPKLGTEFYLKWIPHLALGFSTGVFASFGGDTTTTTATRTRTYLTVNGVPQTPTSDTSSSTVAVQKLGTRGTTFGIGGTIFNLFGNFTIRYVW